MLLSLLSLMFLMSVIVSVNGFAASPTTTTKSGLQFVDLEVGGGKSPGKNDFVAVHYEGKIKKSNKVFGGSRGKGDNRTSIYKDTPFSFKLGKDDVIPGWEEGIASMKVGGKRRLTIPAGLAYGNEGSPDGVIPKNSDLVFDVELMSIQGNMDVAGGMANSLKFVIGLIFINGLSQYVTGHELREYVNLAVNGV